MVVQVYCHIVHHSVETQPGWLGSSMLWKFFHWDFSALLVGRYRFQHLHILVMRLSVLPYLFYRILHLFLLWLLPAKAWTLGLLLLDRTDFDLNVIEVVGCLAHFQIILSESQMHAVYNQLVDAARKSLICLKQSGTSGLFSYSCVRPTNKRYKIFS